jgi:putative sugar O-methyltransferase
MGTVNPSVNFGTSIANDPELLDQIMKRALSAPPIYSPGEYWQQKTANAIRQLRKLGLQEFRASKNSATTSFGDSPILNVVNYSSTPIKGFLNEMIVATYPFSRIFSRQVQLTRIHFQNHISVLNAYFSTHPRISELLERYPITFDTTIGGCETTFEWKGLRISHVYLKLLDTLDHMNNQINLKDVHSVIEIGGGFGVNVDLQLQLFPNIRKVLYVDIAPSLYVGTQYLKSRYGESVIDFKSTQDLEAIRFKNDDSLEIYCILPMQLELVKAKFDLFHNAHSFVEMSREAVINYGNHIKRLLNDNGRVYLVTYDGFDELTIDPEELTKLLSMSLSSTLVPTLYPERYDYHIA